MTSETTSGSPRLRDSQWTVSKLQDLMTCPLMTFFAHSKASSRVSSVVPSCWSAERGIRLSMSDDNALSTRCFLVSPMWGLRGVDGRFVRWRLTRLSKIRVDQGGGLVG